MQISKIVCIFAPTLNKNTNRYTLNTNQIIIFTTMKKLFTLFALLALFANVSWAGNRTIFLNTEGSGWASKTKFWIHTWGGTGTQDLKMSAVDGENYVYTVDIYDNQTTIIFVPQENIGTWTGQSSNINLDGAKNCYSYKSSKWEIYSPAPAGTVTGDLLAVLKGEKIMFYYGDLWGSGTKYLRKSSSTSDNVDSGSSSERSKVYYSESNSTGSYHCRAVAINASEAQRFYISNSGSWAGVQMPEKAVAGRAYILNNNSSVGGSTNNVKVSPDRNGATFSSSTYSIPEGTAESGISAAADHSSSVVNQSISILYYLTTDGTSFTKFDVNDASALAVGEYTIVAVTYDKHIYVKAASATLTVTPASATAHTVTYTAQATGWTYGDKPGSVEDGEDLVFVVNATAGYDVVVKNGDAILTPAADGKTYTVASVTDDIAINVSATAQQFDIVYPASPVNYTLAAGNPAQGATDAEIHFTATPAEGYKLTVSSEQAAITANGNEYSFTMPAGNVTITIEAAAVPMTRILLLSSYGEDVQAWSWQRDGDFKQVSTSVTINNSNDGVALPLTRLGATTVSGSARYLWELKYYGYSKIILKKGSDWNNNKITGNQTDLTAGATYFFNVNGNSESETTPGTLVEPSATLSDLELDQNEPTNLNERMTISGSLAEAGVDFVKTFSINGAAVESNWTPSEAGTYSLTATAVAAGSLTVVTTNVAVTTPATITVNADTRYRLTFTATTGGTVSATEGETAVASGDKFAMGSEHTITFTASPNSGYKFYGWYTEEGCEGTLLSNEATYEATISAAYAIKAVFISSDTYQLKHPWAGGSWDYKTLTYANCNNTFYCYGQLGNGGFNYTSTKLSEQYINPSDCQKVNNPVEGDWVKVIFDPEAKTITIVKVGTYAVAAIAEAAEGTAEASEADVAEGKSVTLTAVAEDGYGFAGWYDNAEKTGIAISEDATYVIDSVFAAVTLYAKFAAETQYVVTVANNINAETSTINVGASVKEVTAEAIAGYIFRSWTTDGDIAIVGEATANPVSITATGTGTLTAQYEAKSYIYLRNTLGWTGDVYAYIFKANVWDGYIKHNKVVAAAGKMTNEGDGLFSFEYDNAEASVYVAFATKDMIDWNDFYGGSACYRGDFNSCRPVFVPKADQTAEEKNSTKYYNSGYWTTSDARMGVYFSYTDHWDATPELEFVRENISDTRGATTVYLEKGTYEFKIHACGGHYYGNDGTIEDNIYLSATGWAMSEDDNNCTIKANKAGNYTFYYDIESHRLWVLYPTYYLKHAWADGVHTWTWKNCDIYNEADGTYTLYADYMGTGVNYNTKAADVEGHYCSVENGKLTLVGDPQVGEPARFTFDPVSETVTIENMLISIPMNQYGIATLYHKENLRIPADVEAAYVMGTFGIKLVYQTVGEVIPANTGVILWATPNSIMTFEGVAAATEEVPWENMLKGSIVNETVDNANLHYVLSIDINGHVGMLWPKNTNEGIGAFTNSGHKAYLEIPGEVGQSAAVRARRGYLFTEDSEVVTGIEAAHDAQVDGKFIINGQLIVVKDGVRYNAQGQVIK